MKTDDEKEWTRMDDVTPTEAPQPAPTNELPPWDGIDAMDGDEDRS